MKKNKNEILISVIVPTFNSKKFILECLNSVIKQTYKNIEIIVVDDCSSDNTLEIVKKFKNKYKFPKKIKIYSTKKNSKTVAAPRNLGVLNCKGDYIAFIDSDDIWHPKKLQLQFSQLKKNYLVCTAANYFSDNYRSSFILNYLRKILQRIIIKKLNQNNGELWLYLYNPIIVSSVLLEKKTQNLEFLASRILISSYDRS